MALPFIKYCKIDAKYFSITYSKPLIRIMFKRSCIHYIDKEYKLKTKNDKGSLRLEIFSNWTHDKIFVSLSEKLTYLNSNSVLVTWFSMVVEHENCRYIYVHFFFCIRVCKHFRYQCRNICSNETSFFDHTFWFMLHGLWFKSALDVSTFPGCFQDFLRPF